MCFCLIKSFFLNIYCIYKTLKISSEIEREYRKKRDERDKRKKEKKKGSNNLKMIKKENGKFKKRYFFFYQVMLVLCRAVFVCDVFRLNKGAKRMDANQFPPLPNKF